MSYLGYNVLVDPCFPDSSFAVRAHIIGQEPYPSRSIRVLDPDTAVVFSLMYPKTKMPVCWGFRTCE